MSRSVRLKEFIRLSEAQMVLEKRKPEDYCFLIYKNKQVSHVFKRLRDFRERGPETLAELEQDPSNSIDLQLWRYD